VNLLGWLALAFLLRRRDAPEPRNPQPHGFGYPSAIGVGVVLTLVSLFPVLCLWAWKGPGQFLGILWLVIVWAIVAAMWRQMAREALLMRLTPS